jgi:hypothetical protein
MILEEILYIYTVEKHFVSNVTGYLFSQQEYF